LLRRKDQERKTDGVVVELAEEKYQHGMICALRIRKATLLLGERSVFIPDIGGGKDIDRYRSSTVQFKYADPRNC